MTPDPNTPAPPTPSFQDQLPADLQGHAALKDFNDVGGLAKSFIDTQAMIGNSVRIPSETATPQDQAAFWTKLGRPDTPDGYELSKWEQPQGFSANDEMMKSFRNTGHELGLTPKQMEGLNQWYGNQVNTMATNITGQATQAREQVYAELKQEFGAATDDKINAAHKAMMKFADDATKEHLEKTGIGNDPKLIRLWMKIAESIGEDPVVNGNNPGNVLTPSAAKEQIATLQRDADFMKQYNDAKQAGHEEAKNKMTQLFQLAYPQ